MAVRHSQPGGSLGYFDSGRHPLHALNSIDDPIDWAGSVSEQPDGPDPVLPVRAHYHAMRALRGAPERYYSKGMCIRMVVTGTICTLNTRGCFRERCCYFRNERRDRQ